VADPTIPGGGTIHLPHLPPSAAEAVADVFARLDRLSPGSKALIASDLSAPPSNDPTKVTVYTVHGNHLVNSVGTHADEFRGHAERGESDARHVGNFGSKNQLIVGNSGNDVINAGAGSGTIIAGNGNNVIDTLASGGGNFAIKTGNGNNTIVASSGNDTILTGTGNNLVVLGTGNDLAYAQGNDTLIAGAGNQTLGAGNGNVTMFAGAGHSTLIGGSGNDQFFLSGGSGNLVVAGTGHTTIQGGAGDNTFIGGNSSTAKTLVFGGTGNETIFGGAGHETMYGGGGANLFAFTAKDSLGGGNNVIGDFNTAKDHIGFLGYGNASQILAHATVVAGSTVINLSDGTKITLVGVTNLNSNNLVTG
jgi:serralysin